MGERRSWAAWPCVRRRVCRRPTFRAHRLRCRPLIFQAAADDARGAAMIPYLLYMMFLGPRLGRLRLALVAFALLAELFVMESHGRDALGGRDVRQAFEDL